MPSWLQTARAWGNGRVIRGVCHAFPESLRVPDANVAACGYKPDPRTTTLETPWHSNVPHCERCERKLARS